MCRSYQSGDFVSSGSPWPNSLHTMRFQRDSSCWSFRPSKYVGKLPTSLSRPWRRPLITKDVANPKENTIIALRETRRRQSQAKTWAKMHHEVCLEQGFDPTEIPVLPLRVNIIWHGTTKMKDRKLLVGHDAPRHGAGVHVDDSTEPCLW